MTRTLIRGGATTDTCAHAFDEYEHCLRECGTWRQRRRLVAVCSAPDPAACSCAGNAADQCD